MIIILGGESRRIKSSKLSLTIEQIRGQPGLHEAVLYMCIYRHTFTYFLTYIIYTFVEYIILLLILWNFFLFLILGREGMTEVSQDLAFIQDSAMRHMVLNLKLT